MDDFSGAKELVSKQYVDSAFASKGAMDAADQALGERIDNEKWHRGWIPSGTDLNDLTTPGVHVSTLGSVSQSLLNSPTDFSNPGRVEVTTSGDQVYQSIWSGAGGRLMSWRRMMDGNGWKPWEVTSPNAVTRIESGTTLSSLAEQGDYLSWHASITGSIPDTPAGMGGKPFTLRVERSSATNLVQTLTLLPGGSDSTPRTWQRGIAGATITDWLEVGAGPLLSQLAPQTGRKEMLKQASRLRRGGVVGTAGATPVALSFDHGLTNFRDLVLPHLIRLGLPCTLALNPDDFGKSSDLATWSEIQGWSLNHGIEMAHHARSHSDVAWAQQNLTGLRNMLLSTIPEMETEMPEVIADAFIQAGASGTFYQGFSTGLPAENWWEHPAGRIVLDNFPVVTSALLGQAVPLTGEPVQTIDRIGMDYGSHATIAQGRIQACYGTHLGVSIFMHPSQLTVDGRISPQNLVSVLEWLAAERDAGRIEVLTVSGHAWSDPNRHTRLDIAPADKWESDTHTVSLAPLMEWVRGAQMVLEATATTTGPLTMSATSDTGGLSASVTHDAVAGQRYRLGFSIPKTATSITLTTQGTERACRVV